mmetsp:Transcript_8869/g.10721  ORF Transcript_8869/g.10721 Transcript_8869/m.10721 type:complete len:109 (-) Transcript_8869:175-501(-)
MLSFKVPKNDNSSSNVSSSVISHVDEGKMKGLIEHVETVETGLPGQDNNLHLRDGDNIEEERVDKDILAYMEESAIEIDDETNRRLRSMIHKRILPCMIVTYFFASIG